MNKILKALIKNEWTPWSILNNHHSEVYEGSGGKYLYRSWSTRTNIGEWFDRQIGIVGFLLTCLYYIIMSPIYFVCATSFGLFDMLYSLFTKKWKDI